MASKKLNNLDIQNLYLASQATKFTLAGLLIFAVLALGYFSLFSKQLETLSEYKNKEVKLKTNYTKKSIEAASLNNLKAELASIRSAFNILLKQLPTDAEIPNLIQELHQAGAANGLRLDSVLPQPHINDGPIQKLPYEITITGKFDQIRQFTRNVGELSRIITLESLSIKHAESEQSNSNKDSKNELLTLNAIATTYKARSEEEVQQEIKEAKQTENNEQSENNND